ncbi:PAS domain S-box protein [Microcoleus sp. FACHB-672]|uniref:PAS domain S-box protein n=1 Tax=Microcoleus sp. FACHB-672 TaxID=2692825 RepID=UPI0019A7F55E|nr:PAS domain S-box protein [Microcoleus sp. FACHB-672]MBD2042611.1 PAS domain S-box protein [Microcoleus sp. FACHB-672]
MDKPDPSKNIMNELALTESELKAFFNLSSDVFCTIGPHGYFQTVNWAWERILGWTSADWREQPWIEFVHPDDIAASLSALEKCSTGSICHFENRYRNKTGLYLWLSWSVMRDENQILYANASDITGSKRLKRQLSGLQERLNAFFAAAPVGLAILDKQLRFVQINQTLAQLNGMPVSKHLGKTYRQVTPQLAPAVEPLLKRILASNTNLIKSELTSESLSDIQQKRHWQTSIFSIEDGEGELSGIGTIVMEITEVKQVEEQLRHRLAIEEMIARISKLFVSPQVKLNQVLQLLGEVICASRAHIYQITEDGCRMDRTFEWRAATTQGQIEPLRTLNTAEFPWWMRQLKSRQIIIIPDTLTMPAEAAAEQEMLRTQHIRSLLAVPIYSTTGTLIGFMGFDDTQKKRTWLAEDVRALQIVSEMIACDWARKQAETELHQVNRTLRVLSACNQAVVRATEETELLDDICRLIVEVGGYTSAWVSEEKKLLPASEKPSSSAIYTSQPMIVKNNPNTLDDTASNWEGHDRSDAALISLPLIAGERTLGALNIYADRADAFDDEELQLLTELARDLAYGIVSLRTQIEHRQTEEALRKSEAVNRAILTAIPDAMFRSTKDGTYIDFIPAQNFEMLAPPQAFLGKKVSQVLPAQLAEQFTHSIEQVLQTGETDILEYQLMQNGLMRHYEARTVVSGYDEVLSMVRDITESKRTQAALQDSEELHRITLSNISDALFITDDTGTLIYVGPSIAHTFNYSVSEAYALGNVAKLLGENLFDVNQLDSLGEIRNIERQIKDKFGNSHFMLVSVKRVSIKQGTVLYTCRDITERKQTKQALLRVRAAVESAGDAIAIFDIADTPVYLNPAFAELFEYSCEQLKAAGGSAVVFAEPSLATQVFDRVRKGNSWRGEVQMHSRTGTRHPVLLRADAIKDETGQIAGLLGIFTDISQRVRAEAALRQSERRLSAVLENMPVMMDAFDISGNIIVWNRECERVTGYQASEMVGNPQWLEILCPDPAYRALMMAEWQQRGNNYRDWEWKFTCKDGSVRTVAWSNVSEQVPLPGWVAWGIGVDVTERQQAEAEIRRLNDELEQRVIERTRALQATNQELEAFSYSVSHDLRAPLRSINGFSQALLEDYGETLDATGKDYLSRVCAATARMGQLIDDLLSLSRVTRRELHFSPVNLTTVAQNVAAELLRTQPQRPVEFKIAEDLFTSGDAQLLRVMLENLLGNAWKFTSKRPHARIEFGVCPLSCVPVLPAIANDNGEISLCQSVYFVRDDGAGFDMAYADKLFGPFQRLHAMADFEGTGIGLATVQRIIHLHGGFVWAESAVEQGATFYFTLQCGV